MTDAEDLTPEAEEVVIAATPFSDLVADERNIATVLWFLEPLKAFFDKCAYNSSDTIYIYWPAGTILQTFGPGTVRGHGTHFKTYEHFCRAMARAIRNKNAQPFNEDHEVLGELWELRCTAGRFTHNGRIWRRQQRLLRAAAGSGVAVATIVAVMGPALKSGGSAAIKAFKALNNLRRRLKK